MYLQNLTKKYRLYAACGDFPFIQLLNSRPKTLNCYGAPYVWAVFMGIGLIEEPQYIQEKLDIKD